MKSRVIKYAHVFQLGIQNTLVYRVNFFFRSALGLIPLIATILLWRAIYAGQEGSSISGFSLHQMISYYLVVTVVDALTAVAEDDWQIAAEIREGTISQFLVKPVHFLCYRLVLFWSGRVIYTAVAMIPVGLFLFFQRDHLTLPAHPSTWGWFALSLLLTGLLQFFISYTMALLAFWILEVSTFIFIAFAFEYAAGGHLFPLDILPPDLAEFLRYTPFPYQLYFPVNLFLERVRPEDLRFGLLMQAGWVVFFFLLAQWVWRRGIRKYTAFGG